LAKIGDTLILYETRQKISKVIETNSDLDVINTLQNIFDKADISLKLVKGKIREIFLSYSQ
jgi:hypothetical protein